MAFSELMNDTVDLLKKDGSKVIGIKASVQHKKIFMQAGTLSVEPDDLILRKMSNGLEETYRVIDPKFYEAFHGIPANYQMEVQKLGITEAKQAIQSTIYNINGNNARVNQNSIDNSANTVNIDQRAIQYISDLRSEIDKLNVPEPEKVSALEIIDTVEGQFQSGSPKKAVISALLSALPHAANIASIVATITGLL